MVIHYILDHNLVDNSKARGEQFQTGLKKMMDRHPSLDDVRGKGLMVGFELVKSRETKEPFEPRNARLGPAGTRLLSNVAW